MISMEICERLLTIKKAPSFSGGRKRRREPENHIPDDIVEEILMKLPASSLIRFQFVSKHWRSLIKSKDFEERYNGYQKTKDPKLLFVCEDFINRAEDALSLRTMSLETTSASLEDEQWLEFQGFKGYLEISESCDGLVCIYGFTKAVEVINPVTAMFGALPLAKFQRLCIDNPKLAQELHSDPTLVPPIPVSIPYTRLGFGKDNVTGRYKLVWLYNKFLAATSTCLLSKKRTICEVFDLQEKKWRFVNTTPLDHNHNILTNQRPAFANGSFYWLTGDDQGFSTTETKLVVFDIHTEMFQVIPTPPCITRDASGDGIGICNLDGRLCVSELRQIVSKSFGGGFKTTTHGRGSSRLTYVILPLGFRVTLHILSHLWLFTIIGSSSALTTLLITLSHSILILILGFIFCIFMVTMA